MVTPRVSRPHMPGYDIRPPDAGSGLLPWDWAREQFTASRNYWLATVGADGQPHALPVWGAWLDDALWFSCAGRSRKRRNLAHQPRCALTTDDPLQPVMLQGSAEIVRDAAAIRAFLAATNQKYHQHLPEEFLDPDVNATVRVPPAVVIAMRHDDFTGSPTRWTFDG